MHKLENKWKSGEISFPKDLFPFPVADNPKVGSCISVSSRSTAATLQSGHALCDHDMADTCPTKAI
jgi:hypothetical protein